MSLMASMSTGPLAHTFGRDTLSVGRGLTKINSTLESHSFFMRLVSIIICSRFGIIQRHTCADTCLQTLACTHIRTLQHVLVGGGGTSECESTNFCLLRS